MREVTNDSGIRIISDPMQESRKRKHNITSPSILSLWERFHERPKNKVNRFEGLILRRSLFGLFTLIFYHQNPEFQLSKFNNIIH